MNEYIYTYHFVGPQILSYNSQTWNLSEREVGRGRERERERTHTKQMTQYNMNKQMSVLQSPKSNTVHNIIYFYGFSNHSL